MREQRVAVLVEIALAVALAAVLNTLKIWRMPNGGTVSFVMLPIIVLALRRGLWVGLLTGALYGVLDFFIDPFPPVHWIQPLLDYPVAYACVGLAGVVAVAWRTQGSRGAAAQFPWLVIAIVIATGARYAVHVVSGVVFFGEYAPPGQPIVIYSMLYNLYVPLSGVLALAAAAVVLPALERSVPAQVARG